MAKNIEQVTIDNSVEKMYVMTYKTIVQNKVRTLYEASMARDAEEAKAKIIGVLKSKGLAIQVVKVELFVTE